jgi:hypothetical protein
MMDHELLAQIHDADRTKHSLLKPAVMTNHELRAQIRDADWTKHSLLALAKNRDAHTDYDQMKQTPR